ncbi:hypothetical protein [Actinoallomurus sp. CA-150999]|uniref:hypothetical protein n=1 Tax=Actinoallomurus sp. CA-150999 TaxID=3239887 RepID=UPI003D8F2B00
MAVADHAVFRKAEADIPAKVAESRWTRMLETLRQNVALILGPERPLHDGDDSHGLGRDEDHDELW